MFKSGEKFRILIPKDKLTNNINGTFNIVGKVKNYPIFYGAAPDGYQNYTVTFDCFGDEIATGNLNVVCNTGSLKVKKVDSENDLSLSGVSFELKKDGSNETYVKETDNNGEIVFDKLYQGKYTLIEKSTGNEYKLDATPININIEYNKQSNVKIGNEKIKGSVKIIKRDVENQDKRLENVKFELYDEDMNLLETLVTDANGEAVSQEYPSVGKKYYLKEIETLEEYNKNEEIMEFQMINNTQKEIVIENELKKGWIRVIKQDLENSNVRLNGVQFELYDEDMNVLETLETNEAGEAISQKYPSVNKRYFLKEIKTIGGYVLDSELKEIKLNDNEILDVFIKNAKTPKESETITIEKQLEPEVIVKEVKSEPIVKKVIIGEEKVIKEVRKLPKTGR